MSGAVVCEKPGSRGDSLLIPQSENWYYYLAHGLGSTMAIVDSSGNSQTSYQYDVYGEVTGGSGSLPNEFDFAGQPSAPAGAEPPPIPWFIPITPPSKWLPPGLCEPVGGGWSPCYARYSPSAIPGSAVTVGRGSRV